VVLDLVREKLWGVIFCVDIQYPKVVDMDTVFNAETVGLFGIATPTRKNLFMTIVIQNNVDTFPKMSPNLNARHCNITWMFLASVSIPKPPVRSALEVVHV
jgi:hypothetical protein